MAPPVSAGVLVVLLQLSSAAGGRGRNWLCRCKCGALKAATWCARALPALLIVGGNGFFLLLLLLYWVCRARFLREEHARRQALRRATAFQKHAALTMAKVEVLRAEGRLSAEECALIEGQLVDEYRLRNRSTWIRTTVD